MFIQFEKIRGNAALDRSSITVHGVREIFDYSELTGSFLWKKNRERHRIGKQAGCTRPSGYVMLKFLGLPVLAHRVAWLYVTGKWPDGGIDHIDRNRSNNAFSNLRIATSTENNRNRCCDGYWYRAKYGTYEAAIKIDGGRISLGSFPDAESARAAYVAANIKHFGSFSPYAGGI